MATYSESIDELSQLDDQICPIDKLYCIHKTYSSISSSIDALFSSSKRNLLFENILLFIL